VAFTPASRVQNRVLLSIGGERFRSFIKLYQAWKEIVGELLASRSHPFRFQNSVLYVAVQNNSWLQELFLRKADIIKLCRAKVADEIKDMIFMIRK
jgi:hypothetical protein